MEFKVVSLILTAVLGSSAFGGPLTREALERAKDVKERAQASLIEQFPTAAIGLSNTDEEFAIKLFVSAENEYGAALEKYPPGSRIENVLLIIDFVGAAKPIHSAPGDSGLNRDGNCAVELDPERRT